MMDGKNKKFSVLVTGPSMALEAMAALKKKADVRIVPSPTSEEQIAVLAAEGEVEAMIIRQGKVTRRVLEASEHLGILVKHGVGVDNIDVETATRMGIPVCITPNANFQSVAELTLAHMFSLSRNLKSHDHRLHSGIWDKSADQGSELFRKTLGLIGIGRIGRRLSELIQPLEMKVVAFDPFVPADQYPEGIGKVDELTHLLEVSDYISIHCPKTESTEGLIGRKELAVMKPTVVLINTSRGGIVDEQALLDALGRGQIRGAGLDCFEQEPLSGESPMVSFKGKLLMTPHIGGVTEEALSRMGNEAVEIVLDWLMHGRINSDVLINQSVLQK